MKRIVSIAFSPNGSTLKWTRAVAAGLMQTLQIKEHFTDITFCYKERQTAENYSADELLVLGVPVYVSYIPSVVYTYLQDIRGQETPCILIASYGNRDYGKSLSQMERILLQRGFVPVGAAAFSSQHCMSPAVNHGSPTEEALIEAVNFGRMVGRGLCEGGIADMRLVAGDIPEGHAMNREEDLMDFPQKEAKTSLGMLPLGGPTAQDGCSRCGRCVVVCPTGALGDYGKITKQERCLKCCACIAVCPEQILEFTEPDFKAIRTMCIEKFGTPIRKNEFFLRGKHMIGLV